jgi:predicted transcriptional regulator
MKPEPSIFDEVDEAWEAEKDARGMADFEAGRVVSHEAVRRWLLSWGTPNELPSPECGE